MAAGTDRIIELAVGDDAAAWSSIGFAVDDAGTCQAGGVRMRFVGAGSAERGIVGWTLAGAGPADAAPVATSRPVGGTATGDSTDHDGRDDIDGLPTATTPAADDERTPTPLAGRAGGRTGSPPGHHPNGVTHIDHLVVITPDLDRTTAAFETWGIAARRTREAGRGRLQRFFRLGEVILELVGPAEPAGGGPATFWGLAFTVADIDATVQHLAGRIGEPRTAVQQGRRIATLRVGDEVSVPVAFMSATDRTDRSEQAAPGPGADGSR